ncbi:hypothetical protein D9611_004026 [Ephemerocybe angulata]|uniref:Uncharacterized protein n=1 Tax=Ephemerocybe angulata TaxID=980116 RepID=A0A8H5B5U2_9AGAR|nr:hypothetical protein D9611_004026 [Tulosesus angulatus]
MSDPQSSQNANSAPDANASQQRQPRVRKPPFADWPTFKILTPPQGQFSLKSDEWVFTWCSQTIHGRIRGLEPNCRSISIRKIFPHEVRNVSGFRKHKEVDSEGKARYPLPAEGQAENLPRVLGGPAPEVEDDDQPTPPAKPATKHWGEGWYLWTSTSRAAAINKTYQMKQSLEAQQRFTARQYELRDLWQDYQDDLARGLDKDNLVQKYGGKVFGSISPPKLPLPEHSLLVHLPPDLPPLWGRVEKFLAPSWRVLNLFRESITSGDQKEFALRVWRKAQTNEPFELARRTCSQTYERWRTKDAADEDEPKKSS